MSNTGSMTLWTQLKQAGFVEGEPPVESDVATPWYVRTMLGIGGWIGAMFLLGFVGVGFAFVVKSVIAALFVGALLCGVAVMIFRIKADSDFASQFAFATSLAGQALILVGLFRGFPSQINTISLLMMFVEALLFLLLPNFLHRVWAASIGLLATLILLNNLGLYAYTSALLIAAFSWVWLNEFNYAQRGSLIRALGYGCALICIFALLTRNSTWNWQLWPHAFRLPGGALNFWIGATLIAVTQMVVVVKLLGRAGVASTSGPGGVALAGAALLALLSFKAPGVVISMIILLIGYAHGNRVLAGLGVLSMLAYLSHYYYLLNITLLQKSVLLMGSGIILLAARLVQKRVWPITDGGDIRHA